MMKQSVRALVLITASLVIGGCADAQYTQQLKRLQSQVGVLDQRVSQLEQGGGAVQAAEPVHEATTEVAATAPIEVSPAKASSKSAVASVKPTTREIQQALKNAGFYQGAVDGKMGHQTREAIKEFQRVHGLHDDGVAGKKTWAKLSAYAKLSSTNGETGAAEILK